MAAGRPERRRWPANNGARYWLLALITCVEGSSDTLLKSLPRDYAAAKWNKFTENPELSAFTKQLRSSEGGPAVVKVLARCRIPIRELLSTFQSEDEQVLAMWNSFAGEGEVACTHAISALAVKTEMQNSV